MRSLSLLGCGWLGFPLAEALQSAGFQVKGSTTAAAKVPALQSRGIEAFQIEVETDGVLGDIEAFLNGSEILIIDIPPRFHYAQKIAALLPYISSAAIKKVLLTSSSGVYGDLDGWVSENTPIPEATTEKAQQLRQAETLLRDHPDFQTNILRFGGLIGPDRHPVRHLAGQEMLSNPEAPVNLIHLQDCIGVILTLIGKELWGHTLNAVAPHHPSREAYYTQKALEMGLVAPKFDHSKASIGKYIDGSQLEKLLDYTFKVPEL